MILRDTAQALTEMVTKCNRLLKYVRIIGGGYFIYSGGHHYPSRKIDLCRLMFYLRTQSDFARLLIFIYRKWRRTFSEEEL